jgi:Fe-S-cluster containining protein
MRTLPKLRCNGCTACCKSGGVALMQGDNPGLYELEITPQGVKLASKPDGSCTYLGPNGCTIHAKRPAMCRAFDCRKYFLSKSPAEIDARIAAHPQSASTFAAAVARL